ncbi:FecCD family ABC transporter permease [Paenibacillus beijingensis]|uniref:Iron-dicitrate transporter subunit FecD n=1 Tax=Paenibacillus beijingensis TaxID=1126833 RepID=A0A0D5NHH0_9BACL|nr:iron chelate uptake ABC transporter family permease subunit [Paenibacillus beijingensis]AJY74829.1 iron-dicitrate transporter subunit FecD [Paenibacillus beijingensis]
MRKTITLVIASLVMLALIVVSLSVGAVSIPLREAGAGLLDDSSRFYFIVHEIRLPRVIVGVLSGCGLAVAGSILQSLVRNPLASPDVIGITQGAGFAAAAVIFLFPASPVYLLPLAAFAGAVAAFLILLALSRRLTLAPSSLALSGVAVGAAFQAGTQYLIVTNPTNINMALLWMSGSLWSRGWSQVSYLLPAVAVLLFLAWGSSAKLNVLRLGRETSISLGLHMVRERFGLFLLAVALAGVSVSAVGSIGFIGLLAPHIARRLIGNGNRWLLPLAAIIGANIMLLGDCLGRMIVIPREVPAGIMTALIGAPYFLYLLRRERKRG